MGTRQIILAVIAFALTSACYRGYKSAGELESDERGPTACSQSCQELGLQMSAFVLVEHETSACVCSPPGPTPQQAAAAAAAAQVLIEQRQQAAQQQAAANANK